PWHMYAVRASGGYPNYNPPLSMFLMAPLLGLAHALHFDANFGEQITFVALPFIVFVPLLGYLVLHVLRALYPEMPETQRLLAFILVVLSPLTWQSIGTWYHLEQPMMLCFLVGALIAFQRRQEGLAGVLAGLALVSRTTALIPLIALGVLLLAHREWRGLLKLGGVAALVAGVVLAPFFLFDRADFLYSFVSWRGTATIGGNSIWGIFAYGGTSGIRHTLDSLARRLDMPSVVVFVAIVAFLAARRLRISAYGRDAWAILAIAALAVPMLSKTNWPYYYLEPFILLLVWEFASMHDRVAGVWRWPVLSFGFLVVAATLSQYIGLQSVGALDRISVGLLEFGSMLAFAVAIWLRLRAAKPGVASVLPVSSTPARAAPAASPNGVPGSIAPAALPANVAQQSPAWAPSASPSRSLPPPGEKAPLWPAPGAPPSAQTPLWPASGSFSSGPLPPGAPAPTNQHRDIPPAWPDLDGGWPPKASK
ncbi:MAG: glycosyltransferase 87 family protein, partial [Ktedonobacterales bacterium]